MLGLTDEQICLYLGVVHETLDNWKRRHPEFLASITRGRIDADAKMAQSLWHRGMGYSHNAVKIFCTKDGDIIEHAYVEHYPPDTNAASLWLRNRQPALWRDKQEIEHRHVISLDDLGDEELARIATRDNPGDGGSKIIDAEELPALPASVVH